MDDKRIFSQFEAEENLFERTYNGVPYWQMLRFMVCESAYSETIEHEDAVKKAGRKKQLLLLARKLPSAYIKSLIQFKKLKKCDIVCLSHSEQKAQQNRFFDYWSMPSDIRVLRVQEAVYAHMLDMNDCYTFVEPYCKGQASYYLKKFFGKLQIDPEEHVFLQELERKVRERFGRSVSAQRMESEILHWIESDKAHEHFFEKFFSKVDCKAIVVVCYYQNQLYSAYRVAKKRGIRVIEFQHGLLKNHQSYWFEDQRGVNNTVPDYFLTFGYLHETWAKLLPTTRAVAVGFPFQEAQLEKWKNLETQKKTVIIYPAPFPEFEKVINEFSILATNRGYRIILKVHPVETSAVSMYYPLLSQNENIEIVTSQKDGIYYWLKLGKHHVMASTTVGFEAVAVEQANICIALNAPYKQCQPLLDYGMARGFTTADELMQLIENPVSKLNDEKIDVMWRKNATENIQSFFKSMKEQDWPESQKYRP